MRRILSYRDLRHLRLVEILNLRREMMQLKTISQMLDVPIRTIHSDIRNLNSYIAPFIIVTATTGIALEIPENYSIRYIYKKILENSLEYQLLNFAFLNEAMSMEKLSDELFISESTTKRVIKKINRVIAEKEFEITTSPVAIIGNEKMITQFMSYYYNELYFQLEYLSREQKDTIKTLVRSVFADNNEELHFNKLKKYTTWIFVNLVRIRNGHYVDVKYNIFTKASILEDKDYCEKFKRVFGVELTDVSLGKLLYVRSRTGYLSCYEKLLEVNSTDDEQAELTAKVVIVLTRMTEELSIELHDSVRKSLLLDIVNLINMRGYVTFILYDRREYFLERLSSNYRHIREFVKSYIEHLVTRPFDNDEINELTYILLTHLPDLFDRLKYIEKRVVVSILVDTDLEHAYFIKKELDNYTRFNIATRILLDCDLEQVYSLPKDEILVTTIPGITNTACKILCFADYFSSRNWLQLNDIITSVLND